MNPGHGDDKDEGTDGWWRIMYGDDGRCEED